MQYFFCIFAVVFVYIFKKPFFISHYSVQSWKGSTILWVHLELKVVVITFPPKCINLIKTSYRN